MNLPANTCLMGGLSCDEAAVCQNLNPPCQMCAIERARQLQAEAETPTVWEAITAYLAIAIIGGAISAGLMGLAGYLLGRMV